MARVIAADPTLADWQRRRARDQSILGIVRRALPRTLAAGVAVADAESGELRLSVQSGAYAAVLRQRGADLLPALAREGWEFTAIKVVVQPGVWPVHDKKPEPNQWDNRANRPLSELRDGLSTGPLKAALAKLLARH
jgi:hypothetical protein